MRGRASVGRCTLATTVARPSLAAQPWGRPRPRCERAAQVAIRGTAGHDSHARTPRTLGASRQPGAGPGGRYRRVRGRPRSVPAFLPGRVGRPGNGVRRRPPPGSRAGKPCRPDPAEGDPHGGLPGQRQRASRAQPRLRDRAGDVAQRPQRSVGRRRARTASLPGAADRRLPLGAGGGSEGGRGGHRALRDRQRRIRRPGGDPRGGRAVPRAGPRDGRVRRHAAQRHRDGCRRHRGAARRDGRDPPRLRRRAADPPRRQSAGADGGRGAGRRAARRPGAHRQALPRRLSRLPDRHPPAPDRAANRAQAPLRVDRVSRLPSRAPGGGRRALP